ncbi:MAG TPA: hypothetical protein VF541_03320 [Longimicrobium sp.]|jgi:hypothetical protein
MRKANLLTAFSALVVMAAATSRCNPLDLGSDAENRSEQSVRLEPAVQKALAVVSTVHAHQMVERAGERVVYHPGWSSRIAVVGARGERREIYRQTLPYNGPHPREVVLGFRDVALAVFDPSHRIRRVTVETLDGQVWLLDDKAILCPPDCPSDNTDPTTTPTSAPIVAPMTAPLEPARLALAPAERARASVSTGPEHRVAEAVGERVTYHPGWSSRITVVDAAGGRREIYRQTQVYHGPHPREVVLGFRDVALAVFDPSHRIRRVTVETLDGQVWLLDDRVGICPPDCPSGNTDPTTTPTPAPD